VLKTNSETDSHRIIIVCYLQVCTIGVRRAYHVNIRQPNYFALRVIRCGRSCGHDGECSARRRRPPLDLNTASNLILEIFSSVLRHHICIGDLDSRVQHRKDLNLQRIIAT
jgi:hypothetical protein